MSIKSRQRTPKRPNNCNQQRVKDFPQPYKHPIPVKFVGLVRPRSHKPKGQTGKKTQGLKRWVSAMLAERKDKATSHLPPASSIPPAA